MTFGIEDGFAQPLEGVRRRLATLRDRLESQTGIDPALQQQIVIELQAALEILQATQVQLQQSEVGAQMARLQTALQEKEILLREIHHRVKNNLQIVSSLLDLQVLRSLDPTVQSLLRNNQSRINSIALVHEKLLQTIDLTEISLGDYVQSLAVMLVRTYAIEVNRVTLQIERVTEVMISPDRAIPIGLILNELISNALKHGLQDQAGTISVRLEMRSPDIVQLAVVNTGRQLPQGFDPIAVSSLGFQLINSLVRQIDGELLLDRNPLTQFRITFDRVG